MAQNVRVIPATMNRMTSAPVASAAKRKVILWNWVLIPLYPVLKSSLSA